MKWDLKEGIIQKGTRKIYKKTGSKRERLGCWNISEDGGMCEY